MRPSKIIGPIEIYESQPLGSGSTGKVFRGKLRNSGIHTSQNIGTSPKAQIQLAVKIIPHIQRFENEVTQYLFESQKQALTTLKHQSVVKCYGVFQDGRNSYLATQLISGGSLKEYMSHKSKINQKSAVCLFKRLLQALQYISVNGFVHRDLKPANIMIRETIDAQTNEIILHPIIIDFGFAERVNCLKKPQMFYNVGSPSYMAPQSYNFTKYSEKSDLWSLGVVFYEILSGQPFDCSVNIDEFFSYTADSVQKRFSDKKSVFSVRCMKILKSILVANQNKRSSVNEVISLIDKLQIQLEMFSMIKRKNLQNQVNNQKVKDQLTDRKEENQSHTSYEFKVIKPRQRQRLRVPSFFEKSKKEPLIPTIEKIVAENSPKHQMSLIPKYEFQLTRKIKSQQCIKPAAFVEKINNFTVKPSNLQHAKSEKHVLLRSNAQYIHPNSMYHENTHHMIHSNSSIINPEVRSFDKLVFNYKSNPSNHFHHYIPPNQENAQKRVQFLIAS